jgi:hypothetical protein
MLDEIVGDGETGGWGCLIGRWWPTPATATPPSSGSGLRQRPEKAGVFDFG